MRRSMCWGASQKCTTHSLRSSTRLALVQTIWNSPSGMAWAALCARALSLVVLLRLVLRTFPAETVTVWLAFNAIAVLHSLCELGFAPTFTRLVAYAVAGVTHVPQGKSSASASPTDWDRLVKIAGTMRALFSLLTVASLLILGLGGSLYLAPLIAATSNPHTCWLAWAVVVATLIILMYG